MFFHLNIFFSIIFYYCCILFNQSHHFIKIAKQLLFLPQRFLSPTHLSLPFFHCELTGGCIIDGHLYLWHLLLLPPLFSPSSLAQHVLRLMQVGMYLGQHQSFIKDTNCPPPTHTHVYIRLCLYTQQCLCMGRTAAEGSHQWVGYKNNFPSFSCFSFHPSLSILR